MSEPLRVAVASYGPEQFRLLHTVCEDAGHILVGYLVSRALRSRGRSEPGDVDAVSRILESLPPGMDLLLPGTGRGVAQALAGYRSDLMVVFGFNWRLPPEVLALPRLGVLNVHPSALPRYRGPAPLLWAIRNGDPTFGMTIHRMDDGLDTGPILAQRDDVPLPDDATPETLWEQTCPVVAELLQVALGRRGRSWYTAGRGAGVLRGIRTARLADGRLDRQATQNPSPDPGAAVHDQRHGAGVGGQGRPGSGASDQSGLRGRDTGGLRRRASVGHVVGAGGGPTRAVMSSASVAARRSGKATSRTSASDR
jgi:hypothetical protein